MSAPAPIPAKYPDKWPMLSTCGLPVLSNLGGAIPHLRRLITSKRIKKKRSKAVSIPFVHAGGRKGSVMVWLGQC